MGFLKKVSYKDIIGEIKGINFRYYEDITSRYKDFELFLMEKDLEDLLKDDEDCFSKLIDILRKDGAVISAIHCPESKFTTCNDGNGGVSENYLSLCEVMRDGDSKSLFRNVLILADKICKEQFDNEEKLQKEIIVVLHEGCEKGCCNNGEHEFCTTWDWEDVSAMIGEMKDENEKDLNIQSSIKIALENVTPFYSTTDNKVEKGKNCGWKAKNQKSKKKFFDELNGRLKEKKKKIQFGACVDFCHIMVSAGIMGEIKEKSEVIKDYFNNIDYKENIFLFHVSNYGENYSHGQLFSFENDDDKKTVETIIRLCDKYKKEAPITFEMADGMNVEKAALNYEHIMFYFSNKHIFGRFSKMLEHDKNKELKDFFDELFYVYSRDKKDVFEITNSLWKVKQIILNNTFIQDEKERIFGVDFDKTEVNLSLVRLKAYVYYTRFCNLGNYLAENYYNSSNYIWDNDDLATEDFGLAMKYFMFNDKIHQCTYTGIMFKFLIDFLPKKTTFYRFNDGIGDVDAITLQEDNGFKEIVGKIPNHISGISIKEENADFYSVGKDFEQCLFKYFDSNHEDWSFKIYENEAINYIDYSDKRYSIQAFTQLAVSSKDFVKKGDIIGISLDISRFSGRRDGEKTDSLEGFLKFFTKKGIQKEIVASISDEEILFTKLPTSSGRYLLTKVEGLILKKIVLEMARKGTDKLPCNLEVTQNRSSSGGVDLSQDKLKEIEIEIGQLINNEKHQVWGILGKIKDIFRENKVGTNYLEELETYKGDEKVYFDKYKSNITCKFEEKENE